MTLAKLDTLQRDTSALVKASQTSGLLQEPSRRPPVDLPITAAQLESASRLLEDKAKEQEMVSRAENVKLV